MRRALAVAAAVLAAAACTTTPRRVSTRPAAVERREDSVRRQLEARYEENRQAFLHKDLAGIFRLRTRDFSVVTPDGVSHDREWTRQYVAAQLRDVVEWKKLTYEIEGLTVQGDRAVVHLAQTADRVTGHGRLKTEGTQREVWVRAADGWRLQRVDQMREARRADKLAD